MYNMTPWQQKIFDEWKKSVVNKRVFHIGTRMGRNLLYEAMMRSIRRTDDVLEIFDDSGNVTDRYHMRDGGVVATKDCKSCEAPVDADGPQHQSAGDCRAAQRKEIRRLRKENEQLRGVVSEQEKMSVGFGTRSMIVKPRYSGKDQKARDAYDHAVKFKICTCRFTTLHDCLRGLVCPKHS